MKPYLTGMDLLEFLKRLDYTDLQLPIAVSEKVTGVNKGYFDDEPVCYLVRISSWYTKKQDFKGFVLEGLTFEKIKELQKKEP